MPILLLSRFFPPRTGGSSRWFYEIYRRVPRSACVIAAGQDPRQADFDQAHDLRIHRLPLDLADLGMLSVRGLSGYWQICRAVRRLVRSEGISQLHCGCWIPEGWIAWLLRQRYGLPYVCYVHGEEVKLAVEGAASGVMASRQLRWMAKRVLGTADFVIANSRNTERILTEEWQLPSERVRLLHPGVDTTRFVPVVPDAEGRRRLGWEGRTVVLTVGRLQKRKGHDCLIRALAEIRKQVPNIHYAIAGDGEERPALEALVKQEGLGSAVQLLGEVGDEALVDCYQQCDLFVLPNRQVGNDIEGFGMVLLEAQACGKPVIAGSSGGTAETMNIPETGLVVSCDEPASLAAAVTELLLDPERLRRMGIAARQWAVEHFDWEILSRQAQQMFGLEQPPPRAVPAEQQVHS